MKYLNLFLIILSLHCAPTLLKSTQPSFHYKDHQVIVQTKPNETLTIELPLLTYDEYNLWRVEEYPEDHIDLKGTNLSKDWPHTEISATIEHPLICDSKAQLRSKLIFNVNHPANNKDSYTIKCLSSSKLSNKAKEFHIIIHLINPVINPDQR